MKICKTCKALKPLGEFPKNSTKPDGLALSCFECNKLFINGDIEQIKKIRGTDKRRIYKRDKNSLKTKKDLRPKKPRKQSDAEYYQKTKEKKAAVVANRRALKAKATPSWLTKIQKEQIKWFYAAARMMTETTGIPHEVDHIHPIKGKGFNGLHVPWNLKVITKEQNRKKKNNLFL